MDVAVINQMFNNIYNDMSKEQIINVLEQVRRERDIAIEQLQNDYGVGFGEKRPVGKWVWSPHAHDWNIGGYECSNCGYVNNDLGITKIHLKVDYAASHYCANCGIKMGGYQN